MTTKLRLDKFLVDGGFFVSREQAQRAIMAGDVRVNDQVLLKASAIVMPHATVVIAQPNRFVGRGGWKLEGALASFAINVAGKTALDIGASTGGFTDCLLQHGAVRVFAVDVGHGQLAWKIRNDSRVVVWEKVNARYLDRSQIPELSDICVIDVSFISLTLILPKAFDLITPDGVILALIKPQFELQAHEVGRGGIVREPALHEKAQQKIAGFVSNLGQECVGIAASTLTGTDGNQEFFACLRKRSG